jgi:hypothetical protein
VSGILPRFFATGKPLSQGYLIKMKIGDVFPPRSGFVQPDASPDSESLAASLSGELSVRRNRMKGGRTHEDTGFRFVSYGTQSRPANGT